MTQATGDATTRLEIDPATFDAHFGRAAFPVRHGLAEHPLLSVASVARLADALPEDRVEHNLGDLPAVVEDGRAPRLDMTPGDIARGIDDNGCWMVLKNIERRPEYRALLDELLDEVQPLVEARAGRMYRREGFVFLSAPGSMTPAHTDPEHNFLLQIRGPKTMNVGRYPSAEERQRDLERTYTGGHRNMPCAPVDVRSFPLLPGDGVYLPPDEPHFVQNGDTVSVSLSITFRTPGAETVRHVHMFNARLRRLGLTPAPGGAGARDRAKAIVVRGLNAVGERLPGGRR
jgi:hypothetical protein